MSVVQVRTPPIVRPSRSATTAGSAVATVLSKLSRVAVTVPPTSYNFTNANANSNPVSYSTGVNLGPIGFTNN